MIPLAEPYFDKEEFDNLAETVMSGWISSRGYFIPKFEESFRNYYGTKYAVSVSNGTAALHLALLALDIKKDDEVIVPTLTFISPVNAVFYCGAKPVFVDAHQEYWGIDPEKIEKAITKKTKAIIIVHLYGHSCDMDAIIKIAKKHNLPLVEDAAEAHGATYKNKKVGSFGKISCFSFFGNKNMTTGEGGMCLTNDRRLFDRMCILKNHGMAMDKKYWHNEVGYNYRMTNMQAAIGIAQLKKLDRLNDKKRIVANWYIENFKNLIEEGKIIPHPKMPWAKNVVWLYTILLNKKEEERNKIIDKLSKAGIESRPFFYPVHIMPPHKSQDKFSVAESIYKRGISLPSSVKLTKEQVDYVTDTIGKII